MSDPIASQAVIVSAVTHGQVKWTEKHREALRSMMDGQPLNVSLQTMTDLKVLLEAWMALLSEKGVLAVNVLADKSELDERK